MNYTSLPHAEALHTLVPVTTILIRETRSIVLPAARPLLIGGATFGRGAVARATVSNDAAGHAVS